MADYTDTKTVEAQLRKANNALHAQTRDVALARQIKEFSSERRKTLLAKFTAPLLVTSSAAAAEATARSLPEYLEGLVELERQYADAENAIAKWVATEATFEAARSLLSLNKEMLRQIDG